MPVMCSCPFGYKCRSGKLISVRVMHSGQSIVEAATDFVGKYKNLSGLTVIGSVVSE